MSTATISLTDQEVQLLSEQIGRDLKATSAPATALTALDLRTTFCQDWPNIKSGLQILQTILGAVPGWGAIAKGAIAIVISIGDAASKAICPASPAAD